MTIDVLLIQPPSQNLYIIGKEELYSSSPPLGLAYIASSLSSNDVEVEILDLFKIQLISKKMPSKRYIRKYIQKTNPRIVGITNTTTEYTNALRIAKAVKEEKNSTIVVMGGPHTTFIDQEPLKDGSVDVVVRNEGEVTMSELVNSLLSDSLKLRDIKGITYKEGGGEIKRTPDRPFNLNLDSLPFPARDKLNMKDYKIPGAIISGRGCPNQCIFCAAGALSGGRYRARSPENVFSEITHLYEKENIKTFAIMDDTFTATIRRVENFCRFILRSSLDITWYCESRVDTINKNLIELMARSGCRFIQFGVESGCQDVLDAVQKRITVNQVMDAVKLASDAGMFVKCSFILGHHIDTIETMRSTIKLAEELIRNYNVTTAWGINTPFPGTYVYDHSSELEITLLTHDWEDFQMQAPLIETKFLSQEDIRRSFFDAFTKTFEITPPDRIAEWKKFWG